LAGLGEATAFLYVRAIDESSGLHEAGAVLGGHVRHQGAVGGDGFEQIGGGTEFLGQRGVAVFRTIFSGRTDMRKQ
jgi:hypothetical protein